ncbi:MAG: response regulator [Candidatus Levyibacteriota bacterium]
MASNVIQLPTGPRWRVLIGHRRSDVRHALRTLIETDSVAVVEVADGEAALAALEYTRFDLLVLELDLPGKDGVTVMQLHRVLLAHESIRVPPPAIILTLAPEVRGNAALLDHLRTLGVAEVIDDAPRREVAGVVEEILRARAAQTAADKPAAA